MSILKRLIGNNEFFFFADFRTGALIDLATAKSKTVGNVLLKNKNLSFERYGNFNDFVFDPEDIGTSDYTVIARLRMRETFPGYFNAVVGIGKGTAEGSAMPLNKLKGSAPDFKIGTTAFIFTGANYDESLMNSVSATYDRDSTAQFYLNGVSLGSAIDISSKASENIVPLNFSVNSLGFLAVGQWQSLSEYEYVGMIKKALTATEIAQLTSELSQEPDWRVWSKAFSYDETTKIYTPEIYFKGEMHALANERTITAGNCLENTPLKIISGSFKIITEKNNGNIEKVIECVTDGDLLQTVNVNGGTGYGYQDVGAGYVPFTPTTTISLTAGDKVIYASENPARSLYWKA